MVTATPLAIKKLRELLLSEQKQFLRIAVKGGGCSGFQYHMEFSDESTPADEVTEIEGIKIIIDPVSKSYLKGSQLDFVDQLSGGGFTLNNPNAKSTCGCGQSFEADTE